MKKILSFIFRKELKELKNKAEQDYIYFVKYLEKQAKLAKIVCEDRITYADKELARITETRKKIEKDARKFIKANRRIRKHIK